MTVSAEEFLRRFMLHVLPRGFVRIRFSGFLANRRRKEFLPLCRQLLRDNTRSVSKAPENAKVNPPAGWLCPHCGGPMMLIAKLTRQQIGQSVEWKILVDTS
jgi:hypothetical protein